MKHETQNTDQGSVTKVDPAAKLPANMMEQHAGAGLEKLTQDDLSMPFLKILMPLSPQCNSSDNRYIPDAKPGMILNSATKALYTGEEGIRVVPCHYERKYLEWAERGSSVGRPIVHPEDTPLKNETTRDKGFKDRLPNGNYLENTASHFVLVTGTNTSTALITMKSTQLKTSKKWNTMMLGIKLKGKDGLFTPPTYSHVYKLKTVQQSNDKGTWFGWDVNKIGPVQDKAVYDQAKSFSQNISKGNVKVKHTSDSKKSESTPF